nr:integrase core domain-containing protein [Blautia coccoides]
MLTSRFYDNQEEAIVEDTFHQAILRYGKFVETKGIQRSYSKKAYPWNNACIESFHALIKREWLNRFKIFNYNHAYRLVFQYIETFYNTVRIHSHCGYLSPDEYENLYRKNLDELETLAG